MKIALYCQYVLGIGHFFRSVEIARALWRHQLIFVTGGPSVEVELPGHVSEYRLPGLNMDANFTELSPTDGRRDLSEVQQERRALLHSLFDQTSFDLFLVELYPFGRKRFSFELLPVLEAMRRGDFGPMKVACSLRDILVEKENKDRYEGRVLQMLNSYFDALLIHADPTVVSLDETFERRADIKIPVVYTGFVAPRPTRDAGAKLRKRLAIEEDEVLVVASAGGGKVGAGLLRAVQAAHSLLSGQRPIHLHLFTGPFMPESEVISLAGKAASRPEVQVQRFTNDFLSFLAAADLSVSMAGYNTCMNVLATNVPALLWPFAQNREQRMRVEKLAVLAGVVLLEDHDLEASRLAELMTELLARPKHSGAAMVNLNGARETARWLESWVNAEEGRMQ